MFMIINFYPYIGFVIKLYQSFQIISSLCKVKVTKGRYKKY